MEAPARRPLRAGAALAVAATALGLAPLLSAQPVSPERATIPASTAAAPGATGANWIDGANVSHVRNIGRRSADATKLLQTALRLSPTVRQIVAALEQSDVYVLVDLRRLPERRHGQIALIGTGHGIRWLSLTLDPYGSEFDLIAWLAHELTHALEIAEAPEVRDTKSLQRLYARLNCRHNPDRTRFETGRAIDAGRQALAELQANRPVVVAQKSP